MLEFADVDFERWIRRVRSIDCSSEMLLRFSSLELCLSKWSTSDLMHVCLGQIVMSLLNCFQGYHKHFPLLLLCSSLCFMFSEADWWCEFVCVFILYQCSGLVSDILCKHFKHLDLLVADGLLCFFFTTSLCCAITIFWLIK